MNKMLQRLLAVAKPRLVQALALCGLMILMHVMTATSEASTIIRLIHFVSEVCVAVVFLSEAIVIGGFSTIILLVSLVIGGILVGLALAGNPQLSLRIVISSGWKKVCLVIGLTVVYIINHELSWFSGLCIAIGYAVASSLVLGGAHIIRLIIIRALILPGCVPKIATKFLSLAGEMARMVEHNRRELYAQSQWKIMNMVTKDGATVNAAQYIHHSQRQLEPCQQKWMIVFLGNCGFFELVTNEAADLAQEIRANVMMFNFRGVGLSFPAPTKQEDLVMDARTVMKYLVDSGVHPHNIMLYGHSLGACVATLLRAEYPGGPLVHDRSFLSLDSVVMGWLKSTPSAVKCVVRTMLPAVMRALGWQMDVRQSWKKVKGNAMVLYHKKDQIINFESSSLEQYLETIPEGENNNTIRLELTGGIGDPHNEWITQHRDQWEIVKCRMINMLHGAQH